MPTSLRKMTIAHSVSKMTIAYSVTARRIRSTMCTGERRLFLASLGSLLSPSHPLASHLAPAPIQLPSSVQSAAQSIPFPHANANFTSLRVQRRAHPKSSAFQIHPKSKSVLFPGPPAMSTQRVYKPAESSFVLPPFPPATRKVKTKTDEGLGRAEATPLVLCSLFFVLRLRLR
ncbi:hypothetical protein NLJ89_g12300 [Agrocybe chaxingu]|uniref:Uncharacterized protein n=1 Tax=Agrocybe chaxingu TaxID=84603 RepID=A0A9W8JND4_9AGAR|nr:hypothetical protein NLJ89_g12300 [Agrocybe chaxingu]